MGTSWSVRVVGLSDPLREAVAPAIERVLGRIIAQMSQWEPDSHLSRFNRAAPGTWQGLPAEFAQVLGAALDVGRRSDGAFDPAIGACVDHWGFGPSGARAGVPAATPPGDRRIEFEPLLLRARRSAGAALDFSGIAKGYAVDAVAACLTAMGLADFLVEIGGELRGAGIKPDGQPWWVDLEQAPGAATMPIRVALHGLSVASSGDYRRQVEREGQRYAHTLDPRTGAPVENGVASVTVLHAECMYADAWATALTVLGPDQGLAVAEREGLAMQMVVRSDGAARELLSPAFAAMF